MNRDITAKSEVAQGLIQPGLQKWGTSVSLGSLRRLLDRKKTPQTANDKLFAAGHIRMFSNTELKPNKYYSTSERFINHLFFFFSFFPPPPRNSGLYENLHKILEPCMILINHVSCLLVMRDEE